MLRTSLRTTALLVTVLALGFGVAHTRADFLYVDNNNSTSIGAVAITRIDTTTGAADPVRDDRARGDPRAPGPRLGRQPLCGGAARERHHPVHREVHAGGGGLPLRHAPARVDCPSGMAFDNAGNLEVAPLGMGSRRSRRGGWSASLYPSECEQSLRPGHQPAQRQPVHGLSTSPSAARSSRSRPGEWSATSSTHGETGTSWPSTRRQPLYSRPDQQQSDGQDHAGGGGQSLCHDLDPQ